MKAIISKDIRVRYPKYFEVGDYSVIDDFCYISTQFRLGRFSHIASNCTIAGGKDSVFICEDFGGLASGVRVYCASDDFKRDIGTVLPPGFENIKFPIREDVILGRAVTIGANSVVMPGNLIPDGVMIGALSFVPRAFEFEDWSVYAGNPLKFICKRDKENVMRQIEEIRKRAK